MSGQCPAVVADGELIPCRVVVWLEADTDDGRARYGMTAVDDLSAREVLSTFATGIIGLARTTGWPTREVLAALVRVTHQVEQEGGFL